VQRVASHLSRRSVCIPKDTSMLQRFLQAALAPILLTLLVGCAGPRAPATEAQAQRPEEDKVVCTREAPTASRMLQTRCYTLRSLEQRRRDDREAAEKLPTRPHDRLSGGS
jgi:hypothetical protein